MLEHRREIDGLRAVAVLPVIFFHGGFDLFSGGFVGVDIFFVISGYLITSIIVTEVRLGTFSLLNFYERRARRILPALFLVVAACIPFAWLWLTPSHMREFTASVRYLAAFVSNIYFYKESGYFRHRGGA
jgi:peptidoglycan/LPS O-acetylase OafA/YrhL